MERGSHRAGHYEPGRDRAYHVGLLIGHGVSACAVHDAGTGEPVFFTWAPGTDLITHGELPTKPRSVSYVMLPEWSTLVPDGAIDPGSRAGHLALVHGKLPTGSVHDEPVRTLGATCLYVHDEAHERKVLERFPSARSLPMQAVLLKGAQQRSTQCPVLLVHRCSDRVDVAVADGLKILLTNTFPARKAEDVLYFCLLAVEKSGLTPDQIAVRYGGTHFDSAERELVGRYFTDQDPAVPSLWEGANEAALADADRCLAALDQFACVS